MPGAHTEYNVRARTSLLHILILRLHKIRQMPEQEINRIQSEINARPIEDFDNLSPADMHFLIYSPFSKESIIQFKDKPKKEKLNKIGFLNLIEYLLKILKQENEIKLTKWNNINTKLATEIYHKNFTNELVIVLKKRKIYKQDDMLSLQNAMIILNKLTKITKVRKNKLSLTKKGFEISKQDSRTELFQTLFKSYGTQFNWAYHDGYSDDSQIQSTLGYILYLLLKYGKEERSANFYAQKIDKAFPQIKDQFHSNWSTPEKQLKSCLSVRCFERFLQWFDFISVKKIKGELGIDDTFIKTNLLEEFLTINTNNFKFRTSKFYA